MITLDDITRSVLMSSHDEWAKQLTVLTRITAVDLKSYRAVLDMIDEAANSLPDIDWVQHRLVQARDAAVEGWAYRS